MKTVFDFDKRIIYHDGQEIDLYSSEAFSLVSDIWLKIGWNEKYSYTFSWMGRPVIQLPEDMIRVQEVIYSIKPDIIIETGVAHGGSLVFYAGLCKAMDHGRVLGVDIEIRPHNRKAIEEHELFPYISLIEGDSVSSKVLEEVKSHIQLEETVMVILDSCHTRQHVLAELEAYCGLVTKGSYIVATDGIMKKLHDVPRGNPEWLNDNPCAAAQEFAASHDEFIIEQPEWTFNESRLNKNITHWPGAWLRRIS